MKRSFTTEVQLQKVEHYVHVLFDTDVTGHDFFHMRRVAQMSEYIAQKERADIFICEAAGLLHDVGDPKLFTDPGTAFENLHFFLNLIQIEDNNIQTIEEVISNVSFSKGNIPETFAGKIV